MTQLSSTNSPLTIIDSSQPANQIIHKVKAYFGHMPIAWGRYFTTKGSVEYSHANENNTLNNNNIKLLPIARHTNHVGGSALQGVADAKQGVKDLFETFPVSYWKSQGSEFFFFLDVEGDHKHKNHEGKDINGSISKEYYKAWSETLVSYSQAQSNGSVTILPCVYANYHDETTFRILKEEGISCHGLWIARYHNAPEKTPSWDEHFAVPESI